MIKQNPFERFKVDAGDLFDKIMENEKLTVAEKRIVLELKERELKGMANDIYQQFMEEQDTALNTYEQELFDSFKDKYKVLSFLRVESL